MKTTYRPTSMMDRRLLLLIMEKGEWNPVTPSIQPLGAVMTSVLDLAILLISEGRREGFETDAAFFPAGAEEIANGLRNRFGCRQVAYSRRCVELALSELRKYSKSQWWRDVRPRVDEPDAETKNPLEGLWFIQFFGKGVRIIIKPKLIEMLMSEVTHEDL
tara:strand:- start:155 stop:637 length:483 start_codon:yes stop_codon:yes gene_type:complete